MSIADPLAPDSTARFRREARRIRAGAKGDAYRTHQQLRELIDRDEDKTPSEEFNPLTSAQLVPAHNWSKSAVLGHRGAAARLFADLVASRLLGPILPFDQRVALLHEAGEHGIGRFEANLIIAAVQHQIYGAHRKVRVNPEPTPTAKSRSHKTALARGLATAVLVQFAILLVAWFLTH
jgi:hypothetical protein